MTLEFRNQPKGGVLVKKVDAVINAPIPDVEFLVTDSDGNLIGNANGKFVTDGAGTFTITDIAPGTTLIIKETRAKDEMCIRDSYKGDVTRTSCDTVVYTAVFSSVGAAASAKSSISFNWLWLLIPVGAAALGGCGYAGYKGYRHYINKKRGYAA